ncbi:glycosyltransferase family 4 protein [Ruminococcus sp.]|uniref:glycosyltransferase family 4 protein n=1 Tax=Ruminococcus sp. TaxID=41978 RepID=UPI00388DEAFB
MKDNITITFFSNFLLHHQTPFCEAMVKRIGDGFRFVATEPVPQERLDMGYKNLEDAPYAVNAYQDEQAYQEAMRLGYESDVVILGAAPDTFIEKRLKDNKLTFRYSERFFKKFRWRFHPKIIKIHFKQDFLQRKKEFYMLCASAYMVSDCRFIFSYPNKTYKWGYFPEIKIYDSIETVIANKKKNTILWAGRLIDWKHPEEAVYLAERLKNNNVDFEMNIIGTGDMEQPLKNLIISKNLQNRVHMLGAMPPERVREHMEQAEIYLFTSDKQEGWGAVLNESMNSACAVVACREIGSVPYLIEDGVNGFIYDKRGKNSLYRHVKKLIDNKTMRETVQKHAYETMKDVWNAESATDRLLHLIDCLQKGTETGYISGPCSRDQ